MDWKPSIRETVYRFWRRPEARLLLLCVSLWRGAHFHICRRSRCGAVHTLFWIRGSLARQLDFFSSISMNRRKLRTPARFFQCFCRKPRARASLLCCIFLDSTEASHASSAPGVLLSEASHGSFTFNRWRCGSFARRRLPGGSEAVLGCRARKIDFLERRLI